MSASSTDDTDTSTDNTAEFTSVASTDSSCSETANTFRSGSSRLNGGTDCGLCVESSGEHTTPRLATVNSDDEDGKTTDTEPESGEQMRALKHIDFMRQFIEQQLHEYQQVRAQENNYRLLLSDLKKKSSELDAQIRRLKRDASEHLKSRLFGGAFRQIMQNLDPDVMFTGSFLRKLVPDNVNELVSTLRVNCKSEADAVQNVAELDADFESRVRPLLDKRRRLQNKVLDAQQQHELYQEQKKQIFEEGENVKEQIEVLHTELEEIHLKKQWGHL